MMVKILNFFFSRNKQRQFWAQQTLDVQLLHRTRSQKGWTSIATDDKIRVTKDRGKVFQLVVTSPMPFTKESISLSLELNGQIVEGSGSAR